MAAQIMTMYRDDEFQAMLARCIADTVDKEISKLLKQQEPVKTILTRQETAALLNISLPTLHDYTKREVIKARRLGNKVRYMLDDINEALVRIERHRK